MGVTHHLGQWDSYIHPQEYTVWYSTIAQKEGNWTLREPVIDIVAHTKLSIPLFNYEPGDSSENYDISDDGIIFCATEVDCYDPRKVHTSSVFFLSFTSLTDSRTNYPIQVPLPQSGILTPVSTPQWCSDPQFHPDGCTVAGDAEAVARAAHPPRRARTEEGRDGRTDHRRSG